MRINHEATLRIPMYNFTEEDAKLTIVKGNGKVGKSIYTYSTLPGNAEHLLTVKGTTLLTSVPGTCSKYCENCYDGGCYAVNSAKQHHNAVIPAWTSNTLLLRAGKLFSMVDKYITETNAKYNKTKNPDDAKIKIFRINVSGEIENMDQFEGWNTVAQHHPEVTFGLYTKNYDDLEKFMDKHGNTADNFVINISQWHGVADEFLAKYPGKFNVFEYDDSNRKKNKLTEEEKNRLATLPHCPAVTAEGKHAKKPNGDDITCDGCTNCYRKTGRTTAVFAH